jgi:hypothetical protein
MRRAARIIVAVFLLLLVSLPAFGGGGFQRKAPTPLERPTDTAGTADAAFNFNPDTVFVPTEPCRVVDTRFGGGGRLAANAVRSFRVLDEFDTPADYTDQGGNPDFCSTSPFASAVAINITAVDPSAPGFVRAWPYDEPTPPVPNATILNYSTALNASNGLDLMVCEEFNNGGTCTKDIFVKNFGASTNLIIDVLGFFIQQTFAAVDGETGDLVAGNAGLFGSERTAEGSYVVSFIQIVPLCGFVASLEGPTTGQITTELDPNQVDPTILHVHTADSTGLASDRSFEVFLRC